MNLLLEIPVSWAKTGLAVLGGFSFLFGIFTAASPRASISLYVGIMARFNWRVSPMDEVREVRTTRLLGILTILLSLALEVLLFLGKI